MADNEELDLNSLLGFEDDAGKATSAEQREVVSDSDAGMSLDDLFAMDDDTSLMDVISINEESDVPPPPPVIEQKQPKETKPTANFLSLDEEGADNEEPQDLNLDFPEESDLFAAEGPDSDNIALTMDTEQEEFQLPVISELQEQKEEEEAEPQLNLTSIFGDDEDESIDIASTPSPTVIRDELPPIPVPEKSEDTSFALPQAVPPVKPLTQSAHSRNDDLISTNDDIDLLFGGPAAPTNNHHGRQSSLEVDFDDDYIGHHDNPRRSRRGIVGLIVTSLVLIVLAFGGFALYSSHLFPTTRDGEGASASQPTAEATSDATGTPSNEPTTTNSTDQSQSSAPTKSALTEQSFVTATKNLGTKTASSVPSSANAINRAIAEVDKNATDESMSKLINEIVAATKAKAPAEATSNKGSQILSVKASKTSKGLVFVVTSTGDMDLSMTVNVDGQVFQFPVQSSTGVATFVYDETIPSSAGYSYVVTSGSQEISAVRSY